MVNNLRELILSISRLSMKEQNQKLYETLNKWMGDNEQVDDICLIGVKV